MRRMRLSERRWHYAVPLLISRGAKHDAHVIHVELVDDEGNRGRGEAAGIDYAGETMAVMRERLEQCRTQIEAGADRAALLSLLPPGGARCALDAALWDLEAKVSGRTPFQMQGVADAPVQSAVTIGIGDDAHVEATARRWAGWPLLKLKVDARDPIAAVDAAQRADPAARFIVDPNQAWSIDDLKALAPRLHERGVALLEQPVPVGAEAGLDGYACPVRLCADELIDDERDLARAAGRFDVINIKLEKAGGLTAGLRLADAAQAAGFGLMVGCMGGSSLAMAPAMVLAQRCEFVDLDGPLSLSADIENGFDYVGGRIARPHQPLLWG